MAAKGVEDNQSDVEGDKQQKPSHQMHAPKPWKTTMVTSKVIRAVTQPSPAPTRAAEDYGRATPGEVSSEVTKQRNHKRSPVGFLGPSREADGYGRATNPTASQKYPSECHPASPQSPAANICR